MDRGGPCIPYAYHGGPMEERISCRVRYRGRWQPAAALYGAAGLGGEPSANSHVMLTPAEPTANAHVMLTPADTVRRHRGMASRI